LPLDKNTEQAAKCEMCVLKCTLTLHCILAQPHGKG